MEPASIRYKNELTHDRLKRVLHYERETGVFTWLVQLGWRGPVGAEAGTRHSRGYTHIMIDQKLYLAHRLAWFYVTGGWPADKIDHIDGNRLNNRFANLREANASQNNQNRKKLASGTSPLKGVSWHIRNRMWKSRIKRDGKQIRLGLYRTEEEAHAAYCLAAKEMFGEYARAA